ncbi:ABC transporter ATP-binding protein [Apilactobacillus ozensis]|uniref:ABC transporter ATP-binding protein n=1 Tax=Apilactobacillus ozensis TaxID=866801 RepID=UPI00200B0BD1|nr:ATP-binding cassette domain-containing protein [Apilactobacillus ozensis]MCK8607083.1 ATP-binding cassette domain-containing protein [Apilactobacillus ozensis]
MLEIKNLHKVFENVTALSNVNFTAQAGHITGLIGQNGAGKSTTFHSILNFINYDGDIKWNGHQITENDFNDIGYLPEERSLMINLTIEQQIIYLARLKNKTVAEIKPKIDDWLNRFEVKGTKKSKIKSLSKGNQQKIQLICTLIHEPKLIILDEPFSGLDPVNADLLKREIFLAKDNGATIIFSSHNMQNVQELCDRLVMLNNGNVVLNGDTQEIRDSFGKTKLYISTDKTREELLWLDHIKSVQTRFKNHYLIQLDNEAAGKEIFEKLVGNQYTDQFSQEPPTLDEIFKMKAGEHIE